LPSGTAKGLNVVADELVMERFRLLDRIGSGGMGTVYRAFDERLQREVAVKEIPVPDTERVLREAQAAARLNHPGIVTLYEMGEQRGSAVLVSELVHGRTLHDLRSAGELSDREVGEVALDICEALAHAHERGVVHRDVKPQNIIVREDRSTPQRAKLLDFGIARLGGAPTLTAAGEVVGTLAYMSPEQAEGAPAGPESDVYSLALTLYECFCGANPVAGPTPAATARRIGGAIAPLRRLRPDLPEGLADLVDASLHADPGVRPSAAELAECFEVELAGLDAEQLVPLPDGAEHTERRRAVDLGHVAASTAAVAASPLLAAIGLGAATAALGATARRPPAAAAVGAAVWAWLVIASVRIGVGLELDFADGRATTEAALTAVVAPESLLAMATFAGASAALAWILSFRHASIALLAGMLWAAGLEAALGVAAGGVLGGNPAVIVGAAATAVAVEFGYVRAAQRPDSHGPEPRTERERAAPTLA
jgi:hypothetical protein